MAGETGREVLLTGATGFVGKVALEALLRRREELGIERVHVLIRPRAGCSARHRFKVEVEPSPCFARLPAGWSERVEVVEGDIARSGCGLAGETRRRLAARITHVMHAAASVDFNLPLADALVVNTQGCLHVLELAHEAPRLARMVAVSTAYVTPHPGDRVPVQETLAPLPRPAADIHEAILAGRADEASLLRETGHPNTYTLTKSLAEHLLVERHGQVPLSIVRPSIVSASWREPFPGWIDSRAAFAGFVALGGTGYLRAIAGRPDSRVDLVPVDVVAKRVIRAAFEDETPAAPNPGGEAVAIHHAVAGLARSPTVAECREDVIDFFRRHPVDRWPDVRYLGPAGPRFALADGFHQILRIQIGSLLVGRGWRAGARLRVRVRNLNRAFPYFTHHSFDFVSAASASEPGPDPRVYMETICRGIHRYLLRRDDTEVPLVGRHGPDYGGDLRFVLRQPEGSAAIRITAWLVTKALRRATDLVSFDLASFERARRGVPEAATLALAPSHRSYLDFVLCSYLCFARPDLGIAIPHTAAAIEFSRIPLLGRLFESLQAFYLERGLGREDRALTTQVHTLVREGKTVEFFIEGGRSRSRRFLEPKRGVLRALQASGASVALLPIALSYDRVPEEASFVRELAGQERPPMRLSALLAWTGKLLCGRVRLGRIHIACGAPVLLDRASDVYEVGREVMAELQQATVVTTFHLRAFLARERLLGMSVPALADAIRVRGGRVLESRLRAPDARLRRVETTFRDQLQQQFYPEARLALGTHPVVAHHLARNDFRHAAAPAVAPADSFLPALLRALFEPVCRDYVRVVAALGDPGRPLALDSPQALVRREPECHLPSVEAAFEDLASRGVLERRGAAWAWGPRAADLALCGELYAWPDDESTQPLLRRSASARVAGRR